MLAGIVKIMCGCRLMTVLQGMLLTVKCRISYLSTNLLCTVAVIVEVNQMAVTHLDQL